MNAQTKITVCDTCRHDKSQPDDAPRAGEMLAKLLHDIAKPHDELNIVRHSCLMGCSFACNIAIQSDQKITYVLGGFEADETAARAIVEYALAYHQSDSGMVPFRNWPDGIKGHFRARIPPLDSKLCDLRLSNV